MKNTFKMIGIIAFVAVSGFFTSCGDTDSGGSGGNVTNEKAVYTSLDSEGNIYELTITPKSDKAAYEPKAGDLFKLVITFANGTMKTSEGTVTDEIKSGSTITVTLSVSGSASFSVSVSTGKDEESSIKEINGSIPITESSDGDTSPVDVSDSPLVPYVPVLLIPAEVASYLAKQPVNTTSSAYNIAVKVKNVEELSIISTALRGEPNKYIRLDLTGSTVTSIENYAFSSCKNLASVTIPDSVASIGEMAFYYCNSLTRITIPDSVTSIGKMAFQSCESLASVSIGSGLTSIGLQVFDRTGLTSVIIPNNITTIERGAFYRCTNLTSIRIGSGVKSIEIYAFIFCESLTSVIIPDSVISIGPMAFQECFSLASVIIGNGVTSIEESAFSYCYSITSVIFKGTIPSNGFSFTFPPGLRDKFYETDKAYGTPGTYTKVSGSYSTWTLQ